MLVLDFHINTFIVAYIVILTFGEVARKVKKNQDTCKYSRFGYMCIVFYYMLLIKVTILPIVILRGTELAKFQSKVGIIKSNIQIIPFNTIIDNIENIHGWIQIIGNLILLAPLVFILKYLTDKKYTDKRVILRVMIVSGVIEIMQLLIVFVTAFPSHATDIDDLILNVLGVGITIKLFVYLDKKKYAIWENIKRMMGHSFVKNEEEQ